MAVEVAAKVNRNIMPLSISSLPAIPQILTCRCRDDDLPVVYRAQSKQLVFYDVAVFALLAPFNLTHLVTLTQYRRLLLYQRGPTKPPRLPYMIPGLRSIQTLLGSSSLLCTLHSSHIYIRTLLNCDSKGCGRIAPFRSWLLFFDMNSVSGSRNIVWIWSRSQHLTNRPWRKSAVGNMFGMPNAQSPTTSLIFVVSACILIQPAGSRQRTVYITPRT